MPYSGGGRRWSRVLRDWDCRTSSLASRRDSAAANRDSTAADWLCWARALASGELRTRASSIMVLSTNPAFPSGADLNLGGSLYLADPLLVAGGSPARGAPTIPRISRSLEVGRTKRL